MTLSEMKKLAEGAKKLAAEDHSDCSRCTRTTGWHTFKQLNSWPHQLHVDDAAYFAACSPERILAILAVCEAAEALYIPAVWTDDRVALNVAIAALRGVMQ